MGTRSYIGMEREDGSVTYIYCHWDGYPSWNGAVLMEHYSSAERMERLLALGDISSLQPRIAPTQDSPHDFSKPEDGVVIAYDRDRGEAWEGVKHKTAASIEAIPPSHGAEYAYVYNPTTGGWTYGSLDWKARTWERLPLTSEACRSYA